MDDVARGHWLSGRCHVSTQHFQRQRKFCCFDVRRQKERNSTFSHCHSRQLQTHRAADSCVALSLLFPFADESDTLCRELSNYIDSINDTVNICQSNYSFTLSLFIRCCVDCSIAKKELRSYCGTRLARHEQRNNGSLMMWLNCNEPRSISAL